MNLVHVHNSPHAELMELQRVSEIPDPLHFGFSAIFLPQTVFPAFEIFESLMECRLVVGKPCFLLRLLRAICKKFDISY